MAFEARMVEISNTIDYTPAADVASGVVVAQRELAAVAVTSLTANLVSTLNVGGVFDFTKTASLVVNVGDLVYFNPVTREANKTAGVKAQGTLTFVGVGVADQNVVIGNRTYIWKATPAAANEVAIGANQAASEANLTAIINVGDAFGGAPHT